MPHSTRLDPEFSSYARWWVDWVSSEQITDSEIASQAEVSIESTLALGGTEYRCVNRKMGADSVKRWIASVLVSAAPSDGLDEIVSELVDVIDFHREQMRWKRAHVPAGRLPSVEIKTLAPEATSRLSFLED